MTLTFWTAVVATLLTLFNVSCWKWWQRDMKTAKHYHELNRKAGNTRRDGHKSGYRWGVRSAHERFLKQYDRAKRGGDDGHRCAWRMRMEAAKSSLDYLKSESEPESP